MKKGQEEAPIELLLAVTLLTFVIILGFYTYQNLCASQYEQKLKSSLSTFARSLEQVYQGGVGTSKTAMVDFGEIGCSSNIESIRLIEGLSSSCRRNLGKDECLELIVRTVSASGSSVLMIEMLNIPPTVTITINDPACPPDLASSWSEQSYSSCGWKAKAYSFRITKEPGDRITLEQLG